MSHYENLALRLQTALQRLAEHPEGIYNNTSNDGIFQQVIEAVPFDDYESQMLPSKLPRGHVNFSYGSHDLVGAGWLEKAADGSGLWKITDLGRDALAEYPDAVKLHARAKELFRVWNADRTARKEQMLRTSIAPQHKSEEAVRTAAALFIERGFIAGSSVFSPERSVWTGAVVGELLANYVSDEEIEGETYLDRLGMHLQNLSDDAKLLLAELTTWQLLPVHRSGMGERTKLARIEAVLAAMEHPIEIPQNIRRTLRDGVFHPGMGMIGQPHRSISEAVKLVGRWLALPGEDKTAAVENPGLWKTFVTSAMGSSFPTQRNSFLYIFHPEYYTPILPDKDKQNIRSAFIGEIAEPTADVDDDLFKIVLQLQVKNDSPINFYGTELERRWKPGASSPVAEDEIAVIQASAPTASFNRADAVLSGNTFIDEGWLQRQLDLLERRRQVILYGPPGTGKTFLAMALADHVAGSAKYTELVQFHPSYSYEDFFEGYRPAVSESGSLTYKLRPGPFRRMVFEALENPEFNYVLVIDEINRGNLSKIFGELYFLLEYRNRGIRLQYSDDYFVLPDNVLIIGTMNTSDRSIALLDTAMRRRFAFVELHPDVEPVNEVLSKWLAQHGLSPEPARLLAELNSRIADPAFRIGPSYLMPKRGELGDSLLTQIWDHELMPLLEEHHYGEGKDVQALYGLEALRRSLSSTNGPDRRGSFSNDIGQEV